MPAIWDLENKHTLKSPLSAFKFAIIAAFAQVALYFVFGLTLLMAIAYEQTMQSLVSITKSLRPEQENLETQLPQSADSLGTHKCGPGEESTRSLGKRIKEPHALRF